MRFWCKFGATLYQTILTMFAISNGVLKTPRDNFYLWLELQKSLCFGRVIFEVYRALLFVKN